MTTTTPPVPVSSTTMNPDPSAPTGVPLGRALPDPHEALPMDPTLPLEFWQAVARGLPGEKGSLEQLGREAFLHERLPLVHAAESLDAGLVADLLDDPEVRAALLDDGRQPPALRAQLPGSRTGAPANEPPPETALAVVLYRSTSPSNVVSNRPSTVPLLEPDDPFGEQGMERSKEVIVAMLLAAGAVPDPIAWLALGTVINPALVDRMMASGHPPLHRNHPHAVALGVATTALHLSVNQMDAAGHQARRVTERLLDHGWDVNALNESGRTALFDALTNGSTALFETLNTGRMSVLPLLLERGATTVWPNHGDHALIAVARRSDGSSLPLLMAHGLAPLLNRPDASDVTPLNRALEAQQPRLAERLLALGALPDALSLPVAQVARERVGPGGMFPVPEETQASWSRVLVALETQVLRAALPPSVPEPAEASSPTEPTAVLPRSRSRL